MAAATNARDERCRYCNRRLEPSDAEHARQWPFCSERCRLAELGRWFGEGYVLRRPLDQVADDAALTDAPPPEAQDE